MTYRAYDGEIFYDKEACMHYEKTARDCMNELVNGYKFFDETNREIPMKIPSVTYENLEDAMEMFENLAKTARYICILYDVSAEADAFINDVLDLYIPEDEGWYMFDEKEDVWKEADE